MTTTFAAVSGPPTVTGRRARLAAVGTGVAGEIYKDLIQTLDAWRFRLIQDVVVNPILFLLLLLFLGRGEFQGPLIISVFVGFLPMLFAHEQVNRMFWGYLREIQSGTLEQTYLSPLPTWMLLLGRQIAAIVTGMISAIPGLFVSVGIVIVSLSVLGDVTVTINAQALVPLAAAAVGSSGIAFFVSGCTLLFKRVELLPEILVAALIFGGGIIVPVSQLPAGVEAITRFVLPTPQATDALREILLRGQTLSTMQIDWGLTWLFTQPPLLLLGGVLFFVAVDRRARHKGTLGHY